MIGRLISWWCNRHRHVWATIRTEEERTRQEYDPNHRSDHDPHRSCYPYISVKTFALQRCECARERWRFVRQHNETLDGVIFNGPFD